MLNSPYVS